MIYKCNCIDVDLGTYSNSIGVLSPNHISKEIITLDICVIQEIKTLWDFGITTFGSCCGHGKMESMVNVSDEDIEKMLSMGYVQNHSDSNRKDTFRLKTVG